MANASTDVALQEQQHEQRTHDVDIRNNDLSTYLLHSSSHVNMTGDGDHSLVHADDQPLDVKQPTTSSQSSFNYATAFAVMTERRVRRKYRGVYKKYSASTQLVTFCIVVYTLAVFTANFVRSSSSTSVSFDESVNLFALVFNLLLVYVVVEIVLVVRWLVYWVLIAELLTLTVTGRIESVVWINDDATAADKATRRVILTTLLAAEVATVVCYVLTHHVYPFVVHRRLLNAERWWNIVVRSDSETHAHRQSYRLTYQSIAHFYKRSRVRVSFTGKLDALHRPHGFGVWRDSSFHGEQLRGQWNHGEPVGPFESHESGSGYCFVNLRIAFCHNRAEQTNDSVLYLPQHLTTRGDLKWGVASIECSVSGGFFSFLPHVTHLTDLKARGDGIIEPTSASECLPFLRPLIDDDGDVRHAPIAFGSSSRMRTGDSVPQNEALVFLHGYNCALDIGLNRLAQLLALGNFPPHVHPFVFSWPTGGVLAYYQAKSLGSESERTANDFTAFLASLVDAGYANIHIITHSMGARVFFNALTRQLLDRVFYTTHERPDASSPHRKARLASLILSNPDYARDAFVHEGGAFDLTRRLCDLITIYADERDGALVWAELLGRQSVFAPLAYSMGKRVHSLHRGAATHDATNSNRSSRNRSSRSSRESVSVVVVDTVDDDNMDAIDKHTSRRITEDAYTAIIDVDVNVDLDVGDDALQTVEFLDVDVIDTTWMDTNVHSIRHNYFNLNPTVIEDIRQIVVYKRRAHSRPGVMRTAGNVSIFLVAPSHVKND